MLSCRFILHYLALRYSVNDQFPSIQFLGKPCSIPVKSESVTFSSSEFGVTITIPPNSLKHDSEKSENNVILQTCLNGPAFQYPEGSAPLSAIYHLSADSSFEKEVEMKFEHFAEIKTKKEADNMTVFWAKSSPTVIDGRKIFSFSAIAGGAFLAGKDVCTLSTKHSGFLSAGTKHNSETRKTLICALRCEQYLFIAGKRYNVLCSYPREKQAVRHAAVAISLDSAAYTMV